MSWCGWVSNPVPGRTTSSLLTSSRPWWESSQKSLVLNRSPARRTSTAGVSGPVVSVIVAPAGGRSGYGSCARWRRAVRCLLAGGDQLRGGGGGVQLRAVLLGDLGADLGRLLTDGVADVGRVQRHDHLVPEIFHAAPPWPSLPAGRHQRCYARPSPRPSGPPSAAVTA